MYTKKMTREEKLREVFDLLNDADRLSLEIILGEKVMNTIQLPGNEWIENNIKGNLRIEVTDSETGEELKKLINKLTEI